MPAILVPVDGSIHALKAISIACDLAEKFGSRVSLMHVLARGRTAEKLLELPVARSFPPEIQAGLRKAASRQQTLPDNALEAIGASILHEAEGRVRRRGQDAERLAIARGDPAEEILAAARNIGANMIIMGCRGLGEAGSSSFGSVSQTVFQKADCTCISVK